MYRWGTRPLRQIALLYIAALLLGCGTPEISMQFHSPTDITAPQAKIVFLAGPDSHLPGAHEHAAGTRLLSKSLRERFPGLETVEVYGGWPEDESIFDNVDAVVMYCDGGDAHLINQHLATFNRLLDAGTGIVALHYCVEVPKNSPSSEAMLSAIGGYFETWWSVNPYWTADYTSLPVHPITKDITPFSLEDEWYFNMRFVDRGVTPILTAVAPLSTIERWNGPHSGNDAVRQLVRNGASQVTAWAYERPGGGRGFGYTGGHYHANWDNKNARAVVLNAIAWVADISPLTGQ
ncbi:MAG: ThuA domain-containing protein [Halioglobus sp.]